MIKVIFDTMIWDKLAVDSVTCDVIAKLVQEKRIQVLVPSTIQRELEESPFKRIPSFFPVSLIGDAVFLADYSLTDCDRVGDGIIYKQHKGNSQKIKDAVIADTANADCNVFVSEDGRCRNRLKQLSKLCQCFSFDGFKLWLREIA